MVRKSASVVESCRYSHDPAVFDHSDRCLTAANRATERFIPASLLYYRSLYLIGPDSSHFIKGFAVTKAGALPPLSLCVFSAVCLQIQSLYSCYGAMYRAARKHVFFQAEHMRNTRGYLPFLPFALEYTGGVMWSSHWIDRVAPCSALLQPRSAARIPLWGFLHSTNDSTLWALPPVMVRQIFFLYLDAICLQSHSKDGREGR